MIEIGSRVMSNEPREDGAPVKGAVVEKYIGRKEGMIGRWRVVWDDDTEGYGSWEYSSDLELLPTEPEPEPPLSRWVSIRPGNLNLDSVVTPGKQLTPYEDEVLTILAEECAEVIQRVCKAKRFGLDEVQPGQELTNAQRLAGEIGNLREMVMRLTDTGIVTIEDILRGVQDKKSQLKKYMVYAPDDKPEPVPG